MKQILFLLAAVLLLGGCAEEKKTDVRWATFNIRYDNPQDSLNNWQYRKDRVCQFIKDHELDIVGMQEVLHNQFQDLRAGLPEYDGIGVGRDDGKTAGEYAPLFYRKDKYEVLDSNTFWLAENPDSVGMMGWDAVCVRIATWAKFKDKATGDCTTDFIDVVAWRQTGEFVSRYFTKGRMAVVDGRLQLRDWTDKDGNKRRSAEVIANNVYFGTPNEILGPMLNMEMMSRSRFSELTDDDGSLPF